MEKINEVQRLAESWNFDTAAERLKDIAEKINIAVDEGGTAG